MKHLSNSVRLLSFAVCTLLLLSLAKAQSSIELFVCSQKPVASFEVGTLHVDKYGFGKQSLILIPGLSCGPWVWFDTLAKLVPNCTVYTVRLPGFDGQPATSERPLFSIVQRDIWALIAREKMVQPVVVGHSLGGMLAIAMAEQHSERLAGVVAVDGLPVFPMTANATPDQRNAMAEKMAADYVAVDPAEIVHRNKTYMKATGTTRVELVEPLAILEAKSDVRAVAAWIKEVLENDLRARLPKITAPLIEVMPYALPEAGSPINYTQDQTLSFYRMLLAGANKVTVVPITPSKHFAMLDQPEAFQRILTDFLASLAQPHSP